MSRNNNSAQLAETIRRQLEQAADASNNAPTGAPEGRLRATKEGELVPVGEQPPLGPDGKPQAIVSIPDANFHDEPRQ